jgi:autoinducer 2-degrading protein
MQVLVVEFRIKAARVDMFDLAISENALASRESEPGCRQFDVCRNMDDPCIFFLYEVYEDEEAIRVHLQSPHFLQMNEITADWVEEKKVRRYCRSFP